MTGRQLASLVLGTLILSAFPTATASAAVLELKASRIQTIATSGWTPASPDPSGLAYVGGDLDRLVVVDGEVEETTGAGFHNVNAWLAQRSGGGATSAINTRAATPTNSEPVGAAYDAARDELHVSKDGGGSAVWVYSRNGSSFIQVRYFTLSQYGIADAEGLAFGNGSLYVSDGSGSEIWTIAPGLDGVVGTGNDDEIGHFDTAALGISDPEGIGFHPVTGNLWVASRRPVEGLLEVTTSGLPVSVASYDFTATNPGGLEVAPSSADPTAFSIWVADRGVDNAADPNENDGRIYELAVGAAPVPPPGENLIVNGDFEESNSAGQPTEWSSDLRFTRSASAAHRGQYSGRHQASDDSAYKSIQDISVVAGQTYSFSGWVNAPPTSDAFKVALKIQWRSRSGGISTVTLGKVTKMTNGWVEVNSTAFAPTGATTARVMMVVSSLSTTVYVDDFVLEGN